MEAQRAKAAARRFGADEFDVRLTQYPAGHIHETWFVEGAGTGDGLVLQRVNDVVFPDLDRVTDNLLRVTAHLGGREPEPERHVLQVVRADDGGVLIGDGDGRRWRAFALIANARAYEAVGAPEAAHEIGRALGRFVALVQDLPGPPLVEPIPHFKDFPFRRDGFELMVDLDPFDRASACQAEIEALRQHHPLVTELLEAMASGQLPQRIVHNDAKAANVLLDNDSGEGLCVIDLDTVAPGVVLFDVGDLLRSATITWAEDAADLEGLAVRDDLLGAALAGYLHEAGAMLTAGERALLPAAGPLMAYESAMRFLTDHLSGDVYYRVQRPRHNLDRARAQLRVVDALSRAHGRVAELVDQV